MTTDPQAIWNGVYKTRARVAPLEFTKKAYGYLSNEPGATILDIGCGDGRDALFFAENGLTVTAIDFSAEAVDRIQTLSTPIDARVMKTEQMDFPDASFDAVYAHLSLHYFDDATTTSIFQNIHRILEPGGYFFVKCKSTKDPYFGQGEKVGENMYLHPYLRHFFTPEYMRSLLQRFTILELNETTAAYEGKTSAFVEAIAQKR